jgi:AcrR family transcriptional regulator
MTLRGTTPTPGAAREKSNGQPRRAEIVRLASQLFRDMGYHSATMDKIAEIAGIAKPTLYHYFRSKEEILFNIHLLYINPLIESQRARVERGASSSRVVYEVILEHLHVIAESPGTLQSFIDHQRELGTDRRQEMKENRRIYRRLVEESFQRDIERGVIPPCDTRTVAFSLFGTCNWASRAHPRLAAADVDELATRLWRLFVFGTSGAHRNEMDPDDFD